jgi:hypothetical protein
MNTKAPTPQQDRPPKQETPQNEGATSETPSLAAAYQQLTPRAILQLQRTIGNRATMRIIQQRAGSSAPSRPSTTGGGGLPLPLRTGIESLSGVDMSDVQVHHNSSDAGQVGALAYAQGNQIHLAPGQEKHLPHEAWHVVQQKLGRVQATGSVPDGRALNDDPALEAEADRMGAQALNHTPAISQTESSAVQRIATDDNAPIQGVFRLFRELHPGTDQPIRNVHFIDLDTNIVYIQVGSGPGETIVPYILVAPINSPNLTNAVAIRAKISYLSREEYASGNWQKDPTFNTDWAKISEEERQKYDITAHKPTPDIMVGTNSNNSLKEEESEELKITPGSFEQGESQLYMLEIGQAALSKTVKLADLITGFTAQVVVLPTAQGELSEGKSLGFQEHRYTPAQVWVQNIFISDERLNTQFGAKQESHTVSFTLSRNATIRLADRTAQELLIHFYTSFQHLDGLIENEAGKMLLQSVLVGDILKQADSAKMPIDRWQALLSNLIRIYFQVYQLSTAATYKRGKANYHGEASARNRLDNDEVDAYNQDDTRAVTKMADDIEKMIDVQFRVDSLGVPQYAFAVNHWIDSLKIMYPNLMASQGKDIIAHFVNKKLAPSFKKYIDEEQEHSKKPVVVNTVKDLLEYYKYAPDNVTDTGSFASLEVGGFTLPEVPLGILDTDFTASIGVAPSGQGNQQDMTVGFGGQVASTFQTMAYTADQIAIQAVTLGNKERPKTKYIESQKSHTVAWTLVRHQMMGYTGRSIQSLMFFIENGLVKLQSDIKKADGLTIAEKTIGAIQLYKDKHLKIHEWQALISALTRWYLIAYSVAESAAYIHPKEFDKAQGHGEAWSMRILRRTEFSLSSGEKMQNSVEEVTKAALGLMDAYVVKAPQIVTLTKEGAINAYKHWNEALTDAFPTLMQQGGEPIRAAMLKQKVSDDSTFGDLMT